jgi:hypothetical protein
MDFSPRVSCRARSILTSSLIASATVVFTVALIAFPGSREASAQGFRLPSVSKNSGGGNVIFLKRGNKSRKDSNWSRGRRGGKGLAVVTGTGGSGKGTGTGGSGRGSSAGNSGKGSGAGKGGHGDGRGRGGRKIYPPPVISGGGGRGIIVGATTPAGPQNFGGGSNPASPGNQTTRRPGSGVPPANERDYVPDEVVIELAADTTDQAAAALAQRFRLERLDSFDFQLAGTKIYRWRISDRRSVPTVVRALEASGTVISVSPNYIMRLHGEETVAVGAPALEQYALTKLQVPQAHRLARGERVLIAIIDGGVDTSHPELAGAIADTFDAIGSGDKVHAHGTAIAGAIAAQARLKGTAPAAQILAARAFGARSDTSEGTSFHVVKAINWAVTRGARIINMSFAGPRDPKIELSLKAARLQGVVLVAAAGNAGPRSRPLYPAADPNVIAVTATDEEDRLFSAANRGTHIAVAAPGVELWLPGLHGTYQEASGTSFAAAEVSGTVALLIERKSSLTHDDVRRALMSTARDLGPRGIDPQFGAGLVDAYRAVLSVAPPLDAAATASGQAPH